MGILDKVMFWKQKDTFDTGNLGLDHASGDPGMQHGTDPGLGRNDLGLQGSDTGMPHDSFGENPQAYGQSPQQPMQHQPSSHHQPSSGFQQYEKPTLVQHYDEGFGSQNYSTKKEFEVLSAKLDALKAGIDAMNQRLATLERELRHKRW